MKMASLINQHWKDLYEIVYGFANTGKENEKTLIFVDRCAREWGIPIYWVEAVVHETRKGCTHRIVTFDTASRNGEPFEAVIQKYGIPNMNYLHCTRELKANPIKSFIRENLGWTDYITAQGIRVDEPHRIKSKENVIYPLAYEWPFTKSEVIDWWKEQPFDLDLEEHQGNCDVCHKKSPAKLLRLAKENPKQFDWWSRMEEKYGLYGHNVDGTPRTFYRGHRSAKDILAMSQLVVLPPLRDAEEDAGCSESCEADF